MSTSILTLNSDQIHIILSNPKLFTDKEIKLAAKRKVMLDKEAEYEVFAQIKRNRDLYSLAAARNRALNAYDQGFSGPCGLNTIVGGWL